MTTNIRIINDGPRDIAVSTIAPASGDIRKTIVVKPGEVSKPHDLYVYEDQVIGVTEVPHV